MLKRLVVTALALVLHLVVMSAQSAPIRLSFEVFKNGKLIAQPSAEVAANATGSLTIDGVGKLEFTPKVRDAEHIAVAFDLQAGAKHLKPSVVIGSERGSLSWTADTKDAFELRVKWAKS